MTPLIGAGIVVLGIVGLVAKALWDGLNDDLGPVTHHETELERAKREEQS